MAVKDHSLDAKIVEAARQEFLAHGFQKASLHKIADLAGITTGALYTRYKNKDALFCSLVKPAMAEMGAHFSSIRDLYEKARQERSADALMEAIRQEEQIYLDLLFDHYEECVLFFCKCGGSSLEAQINQLMQQKAEQTVAFFRSISKREMDYDGIDMILSQQFYYYRQILQRGYSREKAISCMKTVELFLEAGWKAIFKQAL